MSRLLFVVAAALATLTAVAAAAPTATLEIVSRSTGGAAANAISMWTSLSGDGRFVTFESAASNLVPGDTNGALDVFVHDRQTDQTTRVSVGAGGAEADGPSHLPAISGDGRFVAYTSLATNLVPGDGNGPGSSGVDIFVYDRVTSTTERVSVTTAGSEASTLFWFVPDEVHLSFDGRYVVFSSIGNLEPTASDPFPFNVDVYVRDTVLDTTTRLSTAPGGSGAGPASATNPQISADGARVAFSANGITNLVAGDANGFNGDVYVLDRTTGSLAIVSRLSDGTQLPLASFQPAISGDGKHVAWVSYTAANCCPQELHVRDLVSGVTLRERDLTGSAPTQAESSGQPSLSHDGRYVAWWSNADGFVPGDTGLSDAFVHDLQLDRTTRVSEEPSGAAANGQSFPGEISADGHFVAFPSAATNLVAGDANGETDIFVSDVVFNAAPDCSGATLGPATLWPANHEFVAIGVEGITDADGDQLSLSFAVVQDEPVQGEGDGDTASDAQVAGGKLELRAERAGTGDGRVYSVTVTANDGKRSCTAAGEVTVPHSAKKPAVKSPGASFDSFGT